jgi:hypothetical protein
MSGKCISLPGQASGKVLTGTDTIFQYMTVSQGCILAKKTPKHLKTNRAGVASPIRLLPKAKPAVPAAASYTVYAEENAAFRRLARG